MNGPCARATCERLRSLVQDCISKHLYKGAVFFADKLVTLSDSAPADVYLLAQVRLQTELATTGTPHCTAQARCWIFHPFLRVPRRESPALTRQSPFSLQAHYVSKEYKRALTLLNKHALFERNIRFRYLAAKCLAECQEWEECLGLLGADDMAETLKAKVRVVVQRPCARAALLWAWRHAAASIRD